MNITRAKRLLGLCMDARVSSLLVGHSGTAKTAIVGEMAKTLYPDHKFVKLMASQQDVGDFAGIPFKKEYTDPHTGETKVVTDWARPAWMPTEPCVLFLDEVNQAHRDVESALFQLVDEKRIHTHSLHPDSIIVSAINPSTSEYTTANQLSTAFQKRFIVIAFKPESEEFLQWGEESKRIHKDLIAFARLENTVTGLDKPLDIAMDVTPSPRQLERATQLLRAAEKNNPKAVDDIDVMIDILKATLGDTAAAQFTAFAKSRDKPLSFEQITGDWAKYKEVFDNNREKLRNDLVSESVRNVLKGLISLEDELSSKFEFSVPPTAVDNTEDKEQAKVAKKEIKANCETHLGKSFISNFNQFLKDIPSDLFYSFTRDFTTHCPIDTKLDAEQNEKRNNVHWTLFGFFWGEDFKKQNAYPRIEEEQEHIDKYIKSEEGVE